MFDWRRCTFPRDYWSAKEVSRVSGNQLKLVPRAELTSRHNFESFLDRSVSPTDK